MAQNPQIGGLTKAAVVLNSIEEKIKVEVLKSLDDAEIRKLIQALSDLQTLPVQDVKNILKEFYSIVAEESDMLFSADDDTKALILQALGEERARSVLGNIAIGTHTSKTYLESLDVVDARSLANFLLNEHPQTIALVISHLDPAKKGAVIKRLPESLQSEVILRIANMDYVSPDLITALDRVLQKELATIGSVETQRLGGVQPLAEMFNVMDKNSETNILGKIEEKDPMLAEEIRKLMFTFEDLIKIDDRGIQAILKEVPNDRLVISLKTAGDDMKNKVFKNMSERASTLIKEDMEAMGPVRLSDVEKAQQEMVNIARKLEEEGKIIIIRGGEEEALV